MGTHDVSMRTLSGLGWIVAGLWIEPTGWHTSPNAFMIVWAAGTELTKLVTAAWAAAEEVRAQATVVVPSGAPELLHVNTAGWPLGGLDMSCG